MLVVFRHRFISRVFFFSVLLSRNKINSTILRVNVPTEPWGGGCNYISEFGPGNAANFPGGSPKKGGKPEWSLAISSIHSGTQSSGLFHLHWDIKGYKCAWLKYRVENPCHIHITSSPSHTQHTTHTHTLHFPGLSHMHVLPLFNMLNTILKKLKGMIALIHWYILFNMFHWLWIVIPLKISISPYTSVTICFSGNSCAMT